MASDRLSPIRSLSNAKISQKVLQAYMEHTTKDELDAAKRDEPVMVIMAGCPGVGKTSQAKRFIRSEINMDYRDFFNISLDGILENVASYRTTTKALYDKFEESNHPFTEEEKLLILTEVSLASILAKQENLKMPYTEARVSFKIENPGQKAPAPPRKKKSDPVVEEYPTLIDRRMEALQYAIQKGYNILYDVTFSTRNIIEDDLLSSLSASKKRYRIYVLLITSTPEQIRKQLKKRHAEMLSGPNPYIRAIPPQLVWKFIKDNKDGFDMYKDMYQGMTSKHVAGFTFIEIENKPHASPHVSPHVSPQTLSHASPHASPHVSPNVLSNALSHLSLKSSPTKRRTHRSKSVPRRSTQKRENSPSINY